MCRRYLSKLQLLTFGFIFLSRKIRYVFALFLLYKSKKKTWKQKTFKKSSSFSHLPPSNVSLVHSCKYSESRTHFVVKIRFCYSVLLKFPCRRHICNLNASSLGNLSSNIDVLGCHFMRENCQLCLVARVSSILESRVGRRKDGEFPLNGLGYSHIQK